MSYNGYTNAATFHAGLLLDNERAVYDAMREIMHATRDPGHAAPELRALVTDTVKHRNRLLRADEARMWDQEIRDNGGLAAVNWNELAESEMEGVLPPEAWGLMRERSRRRRRRGKR